MKPQQKFWIRTIDGCLPKADAKQSVMELFRSRALVRAALLGAFLNPCLFLFDALTFDVWQKIGMALTLLIIPISLIWLYRATGWLKLTAGLYISFCTLLCGLAQVTAGTIHAYYWIWIPFMIVFAVLVIGVKAAGIYTALTTLLFAWVLQSSVKHGHTLGRFADPEALLSSIALQVVVIQICFFLLMVSYDVIRNRAEVRAVLLRFTDDEAARLADVGERMGGMAQELQDQLVQFQTRLAELETLARRTDTPVADVQKVVRELQQSNEALREISQRAHG